MSTRDEAMDWAVRYFGDPDEKPEDYAEFADALIAEGWRKKPSKAEVIEWALSHFGTSNGTQVWVEFQGDADGLSDAILALMDRGQ